MIITGFRLFLTYVKENKKTGKIYIGRASGIIKEISKEEVDRIRKKRDSSHQKNKEGFGVSAIDETTTSYDAIRGREDQLIREFKELGISGNNYNGISKRNKKRKQYINAAIAAFGDVVLTLGMIYNFMI